MRGVTYVRELQPSGRIAYFKEQLIVRNSWATARASDIHDGRRPITEATYYRAREAGARCITRRVEDQPKRLARVRLLDARRAAREMMATLGRD